MKTYNTDCNEIIIKFTDQNGLLLEKENQVNSTLLNNQQKWHIFLYNQERQNISKDMDFSHSREICLTNI